MIMIRIPQEKQKSAHVAWGSEETQGQGNVLQEMMVRRQDLRKDATNLYIFKHFSYVKKTVNKIKNLMQLVAKEWRRGNGDRTLWVHLETNS